MYLRRREKGTERGDTRGKEEEVLRVDSGKGSRQDDQIEKKMNEGRALVWPSGDIRV